MRTLFFIVGSSCLLSLLLTPLVRAIALRADLVDRPDGRRKIHAAPIPVAGGLAVLLSALLTLGVVLLTPNPLAAALLSEERSLLGLLLASVFIVAVGIADDYGWLRGRHKLLGQLIAVLIVVRFGLVVRSVHVFEFELELGLLAYPFTVLWLLGAINSLNLIDGMDGLLGSVGLIISLAITAIAVLVGRWDVACAAAALAGGLIGFLRYNFPPATIYLGDQGSMLIGLVIGELAIQGSMKGPATVALAMPTALLTIPFVDTAAAIVRRKLTGRSIYTTDRGHLHHCLLRRGMSIHGVLLYVSFFCVLTVLGALASQVFGSELFALLSAAAVVGILIVTRMFGHSEFVLVRKRLSALAMSLLVRGDRLPRQTQVQLQGSVAWTELWAELVSRAPWLNLRMVRLNVNAPVLHECYHARWDSPHEEAEDNRLWQAEFPLTVHGMTLGRLEVVGQSDHGPVAKKIASVMELIANFENAASELLTPPTDGVVAVTKPGIHAGHKTELSSPV